MVYLIPISDNAIINPEQISLITTDSEKGDIEVYLSNGIHLSFEGDSAGEFLWQLDETCFENAPKLQEIRDSYIPDFEPPESFILDLKIRLGEDDYDIELYNQTINNNQILGLVIEEDDTLKIIMGDFQTFKIANPEDMYNFLENFDPDSLPESIKDYYEKLRPS